MLWVSWQIITNTVFVIDVNWPSLYRSFLDLFSFVNLDFVPWQSVGCASPFTYYTKFIVVTATPIGVFLLIVGLYLVPMYRKDR